MTPNSIYTLNYTQTYTQTYTYIHTHTHTHTYIHTPNDYAIILLYTVMYTLPLPAECCERDAVQLGHTSSDHSINMCKASCVNKLMDSGVCRCSGDDLVQTFTGFCIIHKIRSSPLVLPQKLAVSYSFLLF